ncbi:unnamed protein product, partial [Symbiodinium sp. CCMP2456]
AVELEYSEKETDSKDEVEEPKPTNAEAPKDAEKPPEDAPGVSHGREDAPGAERGAFDAREAVLDMLSQKNVISFQDAMGFLQNRLDEDQLRKHVNDLAMKDRLTVTQVEGVTLLKFRPMQSAASVMETEDAGEQPGRASGDHLALEVCSVCQLRAMLVERDLDDSGNKATLLRRLRAAAGSAKMFTCSRCSRVVTEMPCGDRKDCSSCRTLMKQLAAHDVAVQALGVDSATLQGFFAAVAAARTGVAMPWSDVRDMLLTSLSSYHELSHRKVCEVLERPLKFWTDNGYDENHIKLHCPAVNDPKMGRLYRGQLRSEKEVDYRRLSLDLLSKIMEDTRKRKDLGKASLQRGKRQKAVVQAKAAAKSAAKSGAKSAGKVPKQHKATASSLSSSELQEAVFTVVAELLPAKCRIKDVMAGLRARFNFSLNSRKEEVLSLVDQARETWSDWQRERELRDGADTVEDAPDVRRPEEPAEAEGGTQRDLAVQPALKDSEAKVRLGFRAAALELVWLLEK